ncbi:MAG TPA: chemotaxis response regulator protein-glutamate methylesterase [Alphaproteobacteria bacterium]|nr:chemotaxis response regulator protein-glutamate methylesterase [Alphaproteobacteria bacterium]
MLVDDSAVVRGMVARWLSSEAGIVIAASCMNGKIAVGAVERAQPDVIVLDIEMPEMDGLTALPLLLAKAPAAKIIMASTLTLASAEVSLRALTMGATDTIGKPSSVAAADAGEQYRRELIQKIRALGQPKQVSHSVSAVAGKEHGPSGPSTGSRVLRPISAVRPKVLCIGSSTGGPQALNALFEALPRKIGLPILVTQHMPPKFTTILAEHLGRAAQRPSQEARDGAVLQPDHIYVAPGDKHLLVQRKGADGVAQLNAGPPENYCRPAVDPMFRSAAAVYGAATLGVVLTGMGHDGRNGAQAIAAAAGTVIVQDEASSIVWGMPGAVAQAGLASGIYPLKALAGEAAKIISGGKP